MTKANRQVVTLAKGADCVTPRGKWSYVESVRLKRGKDCVMLQLVSPGELDRIKAAHSEVVGYPTVFCVTDRIYVWPPACKNLRMELVVQ